MILYIKIYRVEICTIICRQEQNCKHFGKSASCGLCPIKNGRVNSRKDIKIDKEQVAMCCTQFPGQDSLTPKWYLVIGLILYGYAANIIYLLNIKFLYYASCV